MGEFKFVESLRGGRTVLDVPKFDPRQFVVDHELFIEPFRVLCHRRHTSEQRVQFNGLRMTVSFDYKNNVLYVERGSILRVEDRHPIHHTSDELKQLLSELADAFEEYTFLPPSWP